MDFNFYSMFFALIPLLLTLGLLFLIGIKMPKDDRTIIFILLLISQMLWQLEDVLFRITQDLETKILIERYLCIGWIFIGAFALHFFTHLINSPIRKNLIFLFSIYGITLALFLTYINYPEPFAFSVHPILGTTATSRSDSPDLIVKTWVMVQVFMGLLLILKFLNENYNNIKEIKRVKQVKWVLAGSIVPIFSGTVNHVFFPLIGFEELAITPITLSIFSVFTYLGMKKVDLFNYYGILPIEKILKEMSSYFILVDKELNVIFKNDKPQQLLSPNDTQPMNLGSFLCPDSKKKLIESIDLNENMNWLARLNFLDANQGSINTEVIVQKIYLNNLAPHYLLFGTHGKEAVEYKQKLIAFQSYFKYFIETSNEAFFELDPENGQIEWNDSEHKIFGSHYNLDISDFAAFKRFFRNSRCNEFEKLLKWIQTAEERKITLHFEVEIHKEFKNLTLNAIKIDKGKNNKTKVIGTIRDVTSEYEYFLQISKRDMALKEIVWVQSHLVRAPLANILSLTNLILTDEESDNYAKIELLKALETSAEQLDEVIREVVLKANSLQNQ